MTDTPALDPETTAQATLAGRLWPVPLLGWRSLRRCRGEFMELTRLINAAIAEAPPPADAADDAAIGDRNLRIMAGVFDGLSNDDFDRLVVGPVHAGVAAGSPEVTRAALEALPVEEFEWQLAWLTVRRQSGMFALRGAASAPAEGDDPSGEGQGAARSPS